MNLTISRVIGNKIQMRGNMNANLVDIPYRLSIRFSPNGFSVFVCDVNEKVIASIDLTYKYSGDTESLKEAVLSVKPSLPDCQEVTLICETEFYALIPNSFFIPNRTLDFLKLQHPDLPETHQVFSHSFQNHDSIFIFGYDPKIVQTLTDIFPTLKAEHQLVSLIEQPEHQNMISIWIREKRIDCLVFHDGKTKLLNHYPYQTAEDIVYHALNIAYHLQFDIMEFEIIVYSDEANAKNHEEIITTYLPQSDFRTIQ